MSLTQTHLAAQLRLNGSHGPLEAADQLHRVLIVFGPHLDRTCTVHAPCMCRTWTVQAPYISGQTAALSIVFLYHAPGDIWWMDANAISNA